MRGGTATRTVRVLEQPVDNTRNVTPRTIDAIFMWILRGESLRRIGGKPGVIHDGTGRQGLGNARNRRITGRRLYMNRLCGRGGDPSTTAYTFSGSGGRTCVGWIPCSTASSRPIAGGTDGLGTSAATSSESSTPRGSGGSGSDAD